MHPCFKMPKLTSLVLLTSLMLLTSLLTVTKACSQQGATEQLQSVVLGRCVDYQRLHPDTVCNASFEVNCSQATEDFVGAFAGLPPCDVNMSRYDDYLKSTRHEIPAEKSLFWEGVYVFVHRYSQKGARMTTLEDTLTGSMVDGLRFCSSPREPGGVGTPQTQFCPNYEQTDNCSHNAEASFWSAASQDFASKARGVITIMLNGSTGNAFPEPSYFGTWELPNSMSAVVTHANIWLVHEPGHEIRETCDSAGIKRLEDLLREEGISSTCTENPTDVLWFLCWDHRDHPECQELLTSGATLTSGGGGSLVTVLTAVFFSLSLQLTSHDSR